MMARWVPVLAFAAVLGCGLMAGVFFAFSAFVMRALAALPAGQGAAAMRSISVVILGSLFMAVFMGTAAACVALGAVSFTRWGGLGAGWLLAGSVLYLVGTFGVTAAFNVPLNEALAAKDDVWPRYVVVWTAWNHVRTLASLGATGAFALALLAMARGAGK
jgi:uncharacterized membrane protein